MAQDWGTNDPVVSAPAQSWGMDDAVVGESAYSPTAMAEQVQALVQSKAARRRARDKEAIRDATPRIGVGLRAPFGGEEIGRFDLPEEASAFISEAIKSSPSTAAGIAAASGVTPLANRLAAPVSAIPILPSAIRIGVPLVAGGAAALTTRFAQDKALPQILPESLEQAYDVSSEIAARNPNAAMLGQVAGSGPFFRPGLPIGTEGIERLTVPLVTGGIGAGIEGANQIAQGDFDPQRLALAAGTAALMNRETRLGARIGPNLVLPNATTRATPTELEAMRIEPGSPLQSPSNMQIPTELAAMGAARNQAAAELEALRLAGERYVQRVDEGISADKVRALAERMAGKTPTDQLAILEQEMALQGKTLSEAEQRAGMDMKIELKRQIENQKALETAAKEQQKAVEAAQADAIEAATPPELPKSTQILQESAKPKALANVATEIATQTKQSPYALQQNINKLTQIEAPTPVAPDTDAVGARTAPAIDPPISSPSPVAPVELAPQTYTLKAPRPLDQSLGSVSDALAYRQERIDNYKRALKEEIGLDDAQAERLNSLLARDRDTGRFEKTLTRAQRDKLEAFFDGPLNQKKGPLEQWDDSGVDLEGIATATDKAWLAEHVVDSLGNIKGAPEFSHSDRFLSPVLAINRLKEIGGTWADVFNEVKAKTNRMRAGDDSGELQRAYSESIKRFADQNGLDLPLNPPEALATGARNLEISGGPAPATFVGVQEGIPGKVADIELYNLTEDIPGHPAGSTVSRETLEKAGFEVPKNPTIKGEESNAIREQAPAARVLRGEAAQPELDVELRRVVGQDQPENASGNVARKEAGGEPEVAPAQLERVFYRGTNPESNQRIAEPFTAAKGKTFAARTVEGASQYGSSIEEIKAKPDAKILSDDSPDFWRVIGRKRPPNGYIGSSGKKGESLVSVVNDAIKKAEEAGYDAISIGDADIGTVILNEKAFTRSRQTAPADAPPTQTAELRLNNADIGLPPLSSLTAKQKLAELKAGGVKTYKGKPIEDANPAQLSNALGMMRRGQLEHGGVNPSILSGGAGSVLGGAAGYFSTDDQVEGESDEAYKARLLRNTLAGAAIGGSVGIGAMSRAARSRIDSGPMSSERGSILVPGEGRQRVTKPDPEEGTGVRRLAERVIDDTERNVAMRQALADNPEIIYDKFLLNDLAEHVQAATPQELNAMRVSNDRNAKAAATIELANRASAAGDDATAAALYADASTQFTSSAQLLNVAKLVRSPTGFVSAVKESLKEVGRTTTPAQETEIVRLGKETVKAEQELAKAQRAAEADFSPANQKAFEDARARASKANSALARYVGEITPKGWDDIIIQTIQGNLLTPLSQIANVYGNVLFQPVRRGSMAIASGLDAIYAPVTGKPRVIDRTNPLPRKAELEAFADGTKIAAKELLTGPGTESFAKGEVQRGFRPIRSLVQAITGDNLARTNSGSIAVSDRLKKFTEGTVGVAPEVMFRLLNLGDRGFRRAAEMETLLEQARLRGLKGRDLERFIEFPDKATQTLLNTEARKAIFAQENQGVNKLNAFLDHGLAELIGVDNIPSKRISETVKSAFKIFGRLNVPFRQFPVNYISTAFNFAVPEWAFAQAAAYGWKGNRREMLTNIGEGIMGATMYGAAAYLWKHGLISEPTDKDAKQRSIQYDNMGGQRINLSGLNRALSGGDPAWQRGDKTVDWGRMGIPAPVFYVYTMAQNKGRKELQQTGVAPAEDNSVKGDLIRRVEKFPGMASFALDQSFLAGSAAFLDAMKNGFTGPEGDAWAANMFRAGSTFAVPNTVEALARAEYQYIPELRGDTVGETFKNIWDFKTFQLPKDDRAILKRDIWGEPIARTPPNQNPYVYQFLDVTKSAAKQEDPFKANLAKTFMASDNPNAYPSLPDRSLTVEGVTAKLDPKDYETLQALTGRLRREYSEPLVLDAEFNSIPPQERVAELERIYAQASSDARQQLLDSGWRDKYFGEVFGGTPSERVTRRNTQARSRLEQEMTPAGR